MRYVSIDIETSGLDPEKHQIIEIACIVEDTDIEMDLRPNLLDLPKLQLYLRHDNINFNPVALKMHTKLMQAWNNNMKTVPDEVMRKLYNWLRENGFESKFTVAGKNFIGFDWQFLKKLHGSWRIKPRYRTLDPAILYYNDDDEELPNMMDCAIRMNDSLPSDDQLVGVTVPHRAYEDAALVIKLLRHMGI